MKGHPADPRLLRLTDQEDEKDWEREKRRKDREKKIGQHDRDDLDRERHPRRRSWDDGWDDDKPRRHR